MARRAADVPEDQRIVLKLGINLGDVIADGDDIYGDGVNVAARLETMAEPGGICITRKVRDEIRDKLPYALIDLGKVEVKNISRPVRAFRVEIDGAATEPGGKTKAVAARASSAEGPRIAVLLFDNRSRDPDQEYFSDGLTEDLITELSRFSDLRAAGPQHDAAIQGQGRRYSRRGPRPRGQLRSRRQRATCRRPGADYGVTY